MTPPPLHREEVYPEAPADAPKEPVNSPGHDTIPVENREGADTKSGSNGRLAWGARTDVGLVRSHNEDSFLVQAPVFCVCDGMGGHAAGEVASSIAVETIGSNAPLHADDVLLGAAVEAANAQVIEGARLGKGKPGMGCTASCIMIEDDRIAIAHVGDSRIYLLHHGALVRLTHDHSYVEELIDAGEITADEARVHPSRSVITRALGNDPDMYADHFTLEITAGDRVIVCSDGLSSMVEDAELEDLAVSSASPQAAADNLVSAALEAGGHDNVTVVVVDVLDDGTSDKHHARRAHLALSAVITALVIVALIVLSVTLYIRNSWYLGDNNGTVGIYSGVPGELFGLELGHLVETTSVEVGDLPATVRESLEEGLSVDSEEDALKTVESYRDQIDADKTEAALMADKSQADSEDGGGSAGDDGGTSAQETSGEEE